MKIYFKIDHLKRLLRFSEFNYTVLVLFLFSLLITAVTIFNYQEIEADKLEKMQTLSTNASENLKLYISGMFLKCGNFINNAEIILQSNVLAKKTLSPLEKSKILDDQLPDSQEFEILGITDENGYYIANSEWNKNHQLIMKQKTVSLNDRKYFQSLKNNPDLNFVISPPVISKSTGHWVIVFAKKRFQLENKFIGIELVTISTDKMSNFFKNSTPESNSSLSLYDKNNVLLARYPNDASKLAQVIPMIPGLIPYISQEKASFQGLCPIDHITKLYGFSNIKDLGLRVVWGIPSQSIFHQVNHEFTIIFLIESIIFGIGIFFLYSKFKNLEKLELLQIQESNHARMAMIGEFASGVAHEINNPLMIILGNAQVLLNIKQDLDTAILTERLSKIVDTANRITKIVGSLKNLGHSSKSDELISYRLKNILDDVMQIVNVKLKDNTVKLTLSIHEDVSIQCIPSQLSQVFLNLFSNSIYAISALEQKWIEINTEIKGDIIFIHFTDSGSGIPLEIRSKLMNTFYTTKPIGVGTGLGLSICRKIIRQQNGDFFIAEDCCNTRFTIKMRLSADALIN
jgi:signal transduction histidine kinase